MINKQLAIIVFLGLDIIALIMAIILWSNVMARSICLLLAPLFNLVAISLTFLRKEKEND